MSPPEAGHVLLVELKGTREADEHVRIASRLEVALAAAGPRTDLVFSLPLVLRKPVILPQRHAADPAVVILVFRQEVALAAVSPKILGSLARVPAPEMDLVFPPLLVTHQPAILPLILVFRRREVVVAAVGPRMDLVFSLPSVLRQPAILPLILAFRRREVALAAARPRMDLVFSLPLVLRQPAILPLILVFRKREVALAAAGPKGSPTLVPAPEMGLVFLLPSVSLQLATSPLILVFRRREVVLAAVGPKLLGSSMRVPASEMDLTFSSSLVRTSPPFCRRSPRPLRPPSPAASARPSAGR